MPGTQPGETGQIVELRTKVEVRTWILRASVALIGGLILKATIG